MQTVKKTKINRTHKNDRTGIALRWEDHAKLVRLAKKEKRKVIDMAGIAFDHYEKTACAAA
jgi:hypothetical protein